MKGLFIRRRIATTIYPFVYASGYAQRAGSVPACLPRPGVTGYLAPQEASINVFRESTSTGYKINRGGCLGMQYILRQFGTWVPKILGNLARAWVPKILGNFAQGYQKGGSRISYDTGMYTANTCWLLNHRVVALLQTNWRDSNLQLFVCLFLPVFYNKFMQYAKVQQ